MESCCWLNCLAVSIALFVVYKALDYLLRLPTIGRYSERYILVTGCDSGFGEALARRLDGLGCHVFACCLTEARQKELAKTCSERLQTLQMDVSQHDSVLQAFDFVKSKLPPGKGLWAVVNNAGIVGGGGPEEWFTVDDYKETSAVNLYGLIDVSLTFLPLIKRSRGRVVNMGSIGGRTVVPKATPYSVSKFGVEAFMDGLRRSLRLYGCKVSLIEPGFFCTSFTHRASVAAAIEKTWSRLPAEKKDEFGEEYYKKCLEVMASVIGTLSCANIDVVTDAYQHALFGRFPRARYAVGPDSHLIWLPLSYLPEWIGDFLLGFIDLLIPLPAAMKKPKLS